MHKDYSQNDEEHPNTDPPNNDRRHCECVPLLIAILDLPPCCIAKNKCKDRTEPEKP